MKECKLPRLEADHSANKLRPRSSFLWRGDKPYRLRNGRAICILYEVDGQWMRYRLESPLGLVNDAVVCRTALLAHANVKLETAEMYHCCCKWCDSPSPERARFWIWSSVFCSVSRAFRYLKKADNDVQVTVIQTVQRPHTAWPHTETDAVVDWLMRTWTDGVGVDYIIWRARSLRVNLHCYFFSKSTRRIWFDIRPCAWRYPQFFVDGFCCQVSSTCTLSETVERCLVWSQVVRLRICLVMSCSN